MSSRCRTVAAGHPTHARRRSRRRSALLSLSEKQIQAYLAARDVLRRIQRTHTLVAPPPNGGGDGGDRARTNDRSGRRMVTR